QMQQTSKHMALVVDEYGGIDGLVTIGDIVENIVGEIDDEFDNDIQPELTRNSDGSVIVDARYDMEEFEKEFGAILSEEEREDVDTVGGVVFSIAGRIPARGEILVHEESGVKFEVMDADPRRVNRLKIRNLAN
ncbi:MAG: magnesium/cobalt efflux protein, partial [Pseudomonadales bacterium]|nr:magnesium/cobalt efflux protein [Pseudomonadales bacterium]